MGSDAAPCVAGPDGWFSPRSYSSSRPPPRRGTVASAPNRASAASPAGRDTDHDGLSDDAEIHRYHTDPRKRDTDHDGLSDGAEVLRYKTNPRKPDSDRDGLTDGTEVCRYHTNPRSKDTDRDGLTDGDEVLRYRTDPLKRDTDGDGYGDRLEVSKGKDPRNPRDRPGFPGADNTGVPPGIVLSPYTGPSTISTPNTLIEGKTMGCIVVTVPGVVIRNSKISCDGFYAVGSYEGSCTPARHYWWRTPRSTARTPRGRESAKPMSHFAGSTSTAARMDSTSARTSPWKTVTSTTFPTREMIHTRTGSSSRVVWWTVRS